MPPAKQHPAGEFAQVRLRKADSSAQDCEPGIDSPSMRRRLVHSLRDIWQNLTAPSRADEADSHQSVECAAEAGIPCKKAFSQDSCKTSLESDGSSSATGSSGTASTSENENDRRLAIALSSALYSCTESTSGNSAALEFLCYGPTLFTGPAPPSSSPQQHLASASSLDLLNSLLPAAPAGSLALPPSPAVPSQQPPAALFSWSSLPAVPSHHRSNSQWLHRLGDARASQGPPECSTAAATAQAASPAVPPAAAAAAAVGAPSFSFPSCPSSPGTLPKPSHAQPVAPVRIIVGRRSAPAFSPVLPVVGAGRSSLRNRPGGGSSGGMLSQASLPVGFFGRRSGDGDVHGERSGPLPACGFSASPCPGRGCRASLDERLDAFMPTAPTPSTSQVLFMSPTGGRLPPPRPTSLDDLLDAAGARGSCDMGACWAPPLSRPFAPPADHGFGGGGGSSGSSGSSIWKTLSY